jgi:hypothetical protein
MALLGNLSNLGLPIGGPYLPSVPGAGPSIPGGKGVAGGLDSFANGYLNNYLSQPILGPDGEQGYAALDQVYQNSSSVPNPIFQNGPGGSVGGYGAGGVNYSGGSLRPTSTNAILKDYKHASKIFVPDNYKLTPKFGFLFHVSFGINPKAAKPDPSNPNRNKEISLLVKSASLPKFSVDTKLFNAYNRPNIIQSKIKYDPINITFHDDNSDVIRNLWFDYYNYYYRDSDHKEEVYHMPHKYGKRPTSDFGYRTRNQSGPYLYSISLYSLHLKKFSEYVLINPVIKQFQHGDHEQGKGETMQHSMTIEYETVLYFYGSVSSETVTGWQQLHYDSDPSPLQSKNRNSLYGGSAPQSPDYRVHPVIEGGYAAPSYGMQNQATMGSGASKADNLLGAGQSVLQEQDPNSDMFIPTIGGNMGDSTDDYAAIREYGSSDGQLDNGTGYLGDSADDYAAIRMSKAEIESEEVTSASALVNGAPLSETDEIMVPEDGTEDDYFSVRTMEAQYGTAKVEPTIDTKPAFAEPEIDPNGQVVTIRKEADGSETRIVSSPYQTGSNQSDQSPDAKVAVATNNVIEADTQILNNSKQVRAYDEESAKHDEYIDRAKTEIDRTKNDSTLDNAQKESIISQQQEKIKGFNKVIENNDQETKNLLAKNSVLNAKIKENAVVLSSYGKPVPQVWTTD